MSGAVKAGVRVSDTSIYLMKACNLRSNDRFDTDQKVALHKEHTSFKFDLGI